VYGFVHQSRGLVRIESASGNGTTVRLFMPAHDGLDLVERPSIGPLPDRARSDKTVLLVDDEELARQVAAARLRELGYAVLEAPDGPSVLRLLEGGANADILVTDVGLPNGMNGRQVAEAVREQRPDMPVLFITGYMGTELPPASNVIDKPFNLDTLARRIEAALGEHR
jgi:CheY-like chemotaxis protein